MSDKPEQQARRNVDSALATAGWLVQDRKHVNITAGRGVAIREFQLRSGHGFADYLLYLDGAAAGVVEAKKEGVALTGVELQTSKYSEGLPDDLLASPSVRGGISTSETVGSVVRRYLRQSRRSQVSIRSRGRH